MNPDRTMKALSAPARRQLFELMCERPRSVAELAEQVPVSRPAVSQHLAVLVEADLARVTSVGTRNIYSASPEAVAMLRAWIGEMWTAAFESFGGFATPESAEEKRIMNKTLKIDPVAKTLDLDVTPDTAFDLFVNKMGQWWPLSTHAVSTEDAAEVHIDCRVGGLIKEVTRDGVEHAWGTITAYEADERIQFTWHPGSPEEAATQVDVRFDPTETGTRVTLVHTGWEVRGEDAQTIRDNYESGWNLVLAPFAEAAAV
jgi:DNA-binding transcriptional ArsR family regulator/uncharacterized protein YndB with AHSA1/START domain